MKTRSVNCRVCLTGEVKPFQSIKNQHYWRCLTCAATLLDKTCLPNRQTEQLCYNLHENDPHDAAYRKFLSRLTKPLMDKLNPAKEGLDYGCGPGPALAMMLEEAGHPMAVYDPIFHHDPSVLKRCYDFVTCTETAEHFHQPYEEFQRINRILKPGGWFALMTTFQKHDDQFANWSYRRDPTHVVFYREETFYHLGDQFGWQCIIPEKNVVLMQKHQHKIQKNIN